MEPTTCEECGGAPMVVDVTRIDGLQVTHHRLCAACAQRHGVELAADPDPGPPSRPPRTAEERARVVASLRQDFPEVARRLEERWAREGPPPDA
jgi:hypothetical protein